MISPRSTNDAFAGIFAKPNDKRQQFQVYYKHRETKKAHELSGWYWRDFPFDELTGEDNGPFTSSRAAFRDACSKFALNVEN